MARGDLADDVGDGTPPAGTAPDIRHSRRRWLVLAILWVGVFMLLLDGALLSPTVRGDIRKKRQ